MGLHGEIVNETLVRAVETRDLDDLRSTYIYILGPLYVLHGYFLEPSTGPMSTLRSRRRGLVIDAMGCLVSCIREHC